MSEDSQKEGNDETNFSAWVKPPHMTEGTRPRTEPDDTEQVASVKILGEEVKNIFSLKTFNVVRELVEREDSSGMLHR